MNRIIALIDMDCFYCQVEAKINPSLQGKPIVVAQRTELKDRPLGRIIAVNYEAKAKGVTRQMLATEATHICPELEVVAITQSRGKADLNKYRDASKEICEVLMDFCSVVEKASIDEAYLDITEIISNQVTKNTPVITEDRLYNTYVVGYDESLEDGSCKSTGVKELLHDAYHNELKDNNLLHLSLGALFVQQIREAVYAKTGFRCSAGISHNKILAKISCGLHKPNCQTILPYSGVSVLYKTFPLKKVRSLGGQFGDIVMKELNCKVMADVAKYSLRELEKKFPRKTAQWLFEVSHGIDLTPVKYKMISNSISCCKKFPGTSALKTMKDVYHWINELASELKDRLDSDVKMNKRRGTLLTVRYQHNDASSTALSRSVQLPNYDLNKIVELTEKQLTPLNKSSAPDLWSPAFCFLGICVAKFNEYHNEKSIRNFMKPQTDSEQHSVLSGKTLFTDPINRNLRDQSFEVCNNDNNKFNHINDNRVNDTTTTTTTITTTTNNNNSNNDTIDFSKSFFLRYFKNKENDAMLKENEDDITDVTVDTNESSECAVRLMDDDKIIDCTNEKNNTTDDISNLDAGPSGYNNDNNLCLVTSVVSTGTPITVKPFEDIYSDDGSNISDIYFENGISGAESYPEDFYNNCPYCNKRVAVIQLESHIDHHIALELHRQLNSGPAVVDVTTISTNTTTTTTRSIVSSKPNERKRKKKFTDAPGNKVKSILSFFQTR